MWLRLNAEAARAVYECLRHSDDPLVVSVREQLDKFFLFGQCRAVWVPGILAPPGEIRRAGRCRLPAGHAGDHDPPEESSTADSRTKFSSR